MPLAALLLALGLLIGCAHVKAPAPPARVEAPAYLPPPAEPPGYRSVLLANGLRVSVLPDRSTRKVALRIFHHIGSADEAQDEHGLAHLVEHLLFGATTRYKKGDYDDFIHRSGASLSAYTSPDETVYGAVLLPAQLPELLQREADRMQNLIVTQADLDLEKRIVSEELRLRTESSRAGRIGALLLREALAGHPYGHLAGTPESIDKLTLKQVHAFYARHYRPGNAHLIVVGCIEPEATLAEIRRAFGAIEKGGTAAPPPLVPALHEWRLAEQVESKQDLAPGKAAVLAYPLPPADSPDRWALLVLGKLLTGSRTNRLEADLVKERHDAFAAGLQLTQLRRGGALFFWAAYLPYRRKQTAFKMLTAASERLSKLEWLTEDSLASAKRSLILEDYHRMLSAAGLAVAIGDAQRTYGEGRLAFSRAAHIGAVTLADVRAVYQRYLVSRIPTRVFLTPERVPLWITLFGWLAPLVLR